MERHRGPRNCQGGPERGRDYAHQVPPTLHWSVHFEVFKKLLLIKVEKSQYFTDKSALKFLEIRPHKISLINYQK